MSSKQTSRKDTVPPQKSQTRGKQVGSAPKLTSAPAPRPVKVQGKLVGTAKAGSSGIPKAPATKGLSFKMPKGNKETDIHKRLKKKSPWFTSIKDPLHGADVKIPDETGIETGTVQLVQKATVVTNSNGVAGLRMITPYVNLSNAGSTGTQGRNYQYLSNTATAASVSWGASVNGSAFTTAYGLPFTGVEDLRAISNSHRIVSAALYVQPEPSLSDNKGELCLFQSAFEYLDSAVYDDYVNHYKSVCVPINNNTASKVSWYPLAREDWSFKSFLYTQGDNITPACGNEDDIPPWMLGFVTNGCAAGVTFRATMVVNYEFIPLANTLNILGASPSPQDATEVDLVENWVQEMPVAEPISQRQAASSPSASTLTHENNDEGTGFGMFFNVVKELAPLALALL